MEAKMSSLPAQLCRRFSLDEILSATQNFDDALVIGEGGFGKVYKATITMETGATFIVAIKRLDSMSNQGAPEFWAEIEMLTKLRHCNLVSLIGYCNDNSEMILIYEFMPNGTLDDHLHRYDALLSWVLRLNISIGAARGLHYLHTGTGTQHGVIHRDVKSTNILLDEDYAAKISDFGLAKIGPTNASGAYVKTVVRGTFGYLDPEYFLTQRLTRKSDVFAFGVVLFELLCGRVALDNSLDEDKSSLVKWAREFIKKGKVHDIIDLKIQSEISPRCLKEFVQIAYRCLSSKSEKRPKMAEIVVALELSLTLQNKFDTSVKPAAGKFSIARMIKWSFISPEVNSAQTKSLEKDNSNHASLSKEHSDGLSSAGIGEIQILANNLKCFSFDDLKNATRDFTHDMRLGGGELGEVFEGWIDTNTFSPSGFDGPLKIAIKRFRYSQIQHYLRQKLVDLTFLSELNHPNLVKVLGYSFEYELLFLIYEFMENGSLHSNLFSYKTPLPWKTRVHISVAMAEAFLFLDTTQNHADNFSIKLHQILLDKDFKAKISDVEVAKLAYVDPLYYHPLKLNYHESSRGNTHAFGEVLVQILTGERNSKIGIEKLQEHMKNRSGKRFKASLRRTLDPRLPNVDDTTIKQAMKFAAIAFHCLDASYTLDSALYALRRL